MSRDDFKRDLTKISPKISVAIFDEPTLTLEIEGLGYSLYIPDEYPRGEAILFYGEYSDSLNCGPVATLLQQVLQIHEKRGSSLEKRSDPLLDNPQPMSRENTFSYADNNQAAESLAKDIEQFRKTFGPNSVDHRQLETSEWISLKIPLLNVLTETTAGAWGVRRQVPLVLQLKFDTKSYTDQGKEPRVEMFQSNDKGELAKLPLGQQLSRALSNHLQRNWSGKFLATTLIQTTSSLTKLTLAEQKIHDQLIRMGFAVKHAHEASIHCKTVEEAIEYAPAESNEVAEQFMNPEVTKYDHATDSRKFVPFDVSRGFLCHMSDYVLNRIPTSSKYCVICDMPHIFAANMLRASVCTRDVCVFAFHELNLGSDAAESVATDVGVIDLLLSIFRCAAVSGRSKNILDPFPKVADPLNKAKLAFDPAKPDFSKLSEIIPKLPTTKDVIRSNDLLELRKRLDKSDRLAYPLLEWVVSSNRSHIVKLDPQHLLPTMDTEHQFLLITATPEKEAAFKARKAKHGTKWAFHGSGAENWHSILRNGLKNMSGTTNQLNGAAHGAGIYFAPTANTALQYSRAQINDSLKTQAEFISETGMTCMALCEIVSNVIKDHGWCWTVQDEMAVMTRFFFVYPNGTASTRASGVTTGSAEFQKEVQAAVKYYHAE